MRRNKGYALVASALAFLAAVAVLPSTADASSHREAPLISQDPQADNTDLYAWRDATDPTKLNIVANYIGLELPQGGPNFTRFSDDVEYTIHIDNNSDAVDDIFYKFRFRTTVNQPGTFLYGGYDGATAAPIAAPNDARHNVRQSYSVQKSVGNGTPQTIGSEVPTPPVNVGPRTTPNYAANLVPSTITTLGGDVKVFAGQRDDPFFADLGSIFDFAALRPIQSLHAVQPGGTPNANQAGVDGLAGKNVHSIAMQIPIATLTSTGTVPTTVDAKSSLVNVWASSARQRVKVLSTGGGQPRNAGRWVQVSRLGLPLINEVLIPLGQKDRWNSAAPVDDAAVFGSFILDPEPTRLLPALYPAVFNAGGSSRVPPGGAASRTDILGLITGQFSGLSAATAATVTPADVLRVNVAVAPVAVAAENRLGALGGDAAGFPNGRRLKDDVVDIELQVLAGVLLSGFGNGNPATAVPGGSGATYAALADGVNTNDEAQLGSFPYVPTPNNGYNQQAPGNAAP